MKIILFGASGMVGQGALRECLAAPDVARVLVVTRSALGQADPKLRELVHADFGEFGPVAGELAGYDACLFCLGVSSAGMTEAEYTRVTYDYTLAAARVLVAQTPAMTFIYVSGAGTRSDEQGGMWARVKGRTENALLALPFKAAYMFRPGFIQPKHGIVSKTKSYRVLYAIVSPISPLLRWLFPRAIATTETMGRALLEAARHGAPAKIIGGREIEELARGPKKS